MSKGKPDLLRFNESSVFSLSIHLQRWGDQEDDNRDKQLKDRQVERKGRLKAWADVRRGDSRNEWREGV